MTYLSVVWKKSEKFTGFSFSHFKMIFSFFKRKQGETCVAVLATAAH